MTMPALRPLSTPELLDRTFSLYRSRFLLFAGIIAIPNLLTLATNLLRIAFYPSAFSPQSLTMLSTSYLVWTLVSVVVAMAVVAASMGGTAIGISHVYLGRPISVVGALSHVWPRIPRLVGLMLVVGIVAASLPMAAFMATMVLVGLRNPLAILTGLATIPAAVAAVMIALAWSLAVPAATLEDRGLFGALARSRELTKGDRLRILLVMAVFVLIIWVVQLLITLPVAVVTFLRAMAAGTTAVVPPWLQVLAVVSSLVAQCIVGPLMTIGAVVLYYDNRVRKEAFDLELMMAAVDGRTPTP